MAYTGDTTLLELGLQGGGVGMVNQPIKRGVPRLRESNRLTLKTFF